MFRKLLTGDWCCPGVRSEERSMDTVKEAMKTEILDAVEKLQQNAVPSLADILGQLKNRAVLIYGAGSFGGEMFDILTDYQVSVQAFLDIKAEKGHMKCNVPVYRADDPDLAVDLKNQATVVFAIVIDKNSREKIYD